MEEEAVMSSDDSSIGEAVSGRGGGDYVEEEDLYYIPERRPSLDLGTSPMDISQWYQEIFDVLAFIVLTVGKMFLSNKPYINFPQSVKVKLVGLFCLGI